MNKFIVIIRPTFMQFCKDACRAASLNHLLFRIAGKSKDQAREKIQAGDILWYAKNEQITEEMAHAWGVCKVGKEVNRLISMGLIGRRSNPAWGADRTKHFCFGTDQCTKLLDYCNEQNICVVHLDLPPEVMHLIYSSNANDTSIKCICAIHQMETIDVSDANDRSIEAIPIDSPTEIDYKDNNEEEGTGATAPTPASSLSQQIDALRERTDDLLTETDKRTAIHKRQFARNGGLDVAVHDADNRGAPRDDVGPLDGQQRPGRAPLCSADRADRGADMAVGAARPLAESPGLTHSPGLLSQDGAVSPQKPRASGATSKKASVTQVPPTIPQMPADDADWTAATCRQLFDAWRGVTLIGVYKNSQASTCAKGLVERYSRAEVEAAKRKMDRDKYYVERGGADICDVANNIHKYRKRARAATSPTPLEELEPYSFAWLAAQRGNA